MSSSSPSSFTKMSSQINNHLNYCQARGGGRWSRLSFHFPPPVRAGHPGQVKHLDIQITKVIIFTNIIGHPGQVKHSQVQITKVFIIINIIGHPGQVKHLEIQITKVIIIINIIGYPSQVEHSVQIKSHHYDHCLQHWDMLLWITKVIALSSAI